MENEKQKQLTSSTPTYCCISHGFQQIASTYPNKVAIIHSTKPNKHQKIFTFSQLLSAIDFLTSKLNHIINGGDDPFLIKPTSNNLNFNVKPKLFGVYMIPSLEYVVTILSILRIGVVFVPLDPVWPKERIFNVISSSNVDLIIGCSNFGKNNSAHLVDESHWLVKCSKFHVFCVSFDGFFENNNPVLSHRCGNVVFQKGDNNDNPVWSHRCGDEVFQKDDNNNNNSVLSHRNEIFQKGDNYNNPVWSHRCGGAFFEKRSGKFELGWPCESESERKFFCYLMYTSGSTGKPKGVCGTEEGVLNRFLWMQEFYPLKLDDVVLFKTSISFIDHLQEFLGPMLVGCTLVVPPFDVVKGDFYGIVDLLHDYSITRMTAVPSLMRALVPALEGRNSELVESSLKVLVLSGEVFPVPLWRMLSRIFPRTCILNIYGSTEVSGDCACFDCGLLPEILESEMLSSVPIGKPISNCRIELIVKEGKRDEGEICVSGACLSRGYYSDGNIIPLDYVELSGKLYYRMGDFAKRLPSGDLVFCGREDRTIKVNGHRIALEEVEDVLRGYPDIENAAVVFCNEQEGSAFLGAVVVLKDDSKSSQISGDVRSWLMDRLPSVMIPKKILCHDALPFSSTGKVNYAILSSFFTRLDGPNKGHVQCNRTLGHIKEAFCDSLDVAEVGNADDFFAMGGDSILAAHCAYKLGIDMRLLYMFPTPSRLQKALMEKEGPLGNDEINWQMLPKSRKGDLLDSPGSGLVKSRKFGETISNDNKDEYGKFKHLKVDVGLNSDVKGVTITSLSSFLWESPSISVECGITRCNKIVHNNKCGSDLETRSFELPRHSKGFLQEIWKVPLDSCVDASPLVIIKDNQMLVFVGSHSHKFLCINARNGSIIWELKLEGRIECSAMMDGDLSQVIVGCYKGKIYFIDMIKGNINWSFLTGGEVKSQPILDKCRHLIWCGSYDHKLYGLDYRNHRCVYQFPCRGSIFGSPAIDEARHILYVGTTNGNMTAISLKASTFCIIWSIELEAPIFGSLSISSNGNVLCCLVNGDVLSVNQEGSIVWRVKAGGPIFAGPCISKALDSQALVCSRNGNVYSIELEEGKILWEYHAGDPITASAYVDDNIKLISGDSRSPSERFVCICSSSGRIVLLRVSCGVTADGSVKDLVKKFAEFDLQGDIFSSPVMIGGRIFVGCRDDFLHCIVAESSPMTNGFESS